MGLVNRKTAQKRIEKAINAEPFTTLTEVYTRINHHLDTGTCVFGMHVTKELAPKLKKALKTKGYGVIVDTTYWYENAVYIEITI